MNVPSFVYDSNWHFFNNDILNYKTTFKVSSIINELFKTPVGLMYV